MFSVLWNFFSFMREPSQCCGCEIKEERLFETCAEYSSTVEPVNIGIISPDQPENHEME